MPPHQENGAGGHEESDPEERDADWAVKRLGQIRQELAQAGRTDEVKEVDHIIEVGDYVLSQPENHGQHWYRLWDLQTTKLRPAVSNKLRDAFAERKGEFEEEVRPGDQTSTRDLSTVGQNIDQELDGGVYLFG